MDSLQRVDEQVVGQRGYQYHHRLTSRRRQGSGRQVGHIAEAGGRLLHALDQLGRDRGNPAQGP